MRATHRSRQGLRRVVSVIAGAFTVIAAVAAAPAAITVNAGTALAATGRVSAKPASGTPQLAPTGTTEQVRQIKQCGGNMYAVGSFTSIKWGGATYARNNAFSFSATAPYRVTSWNPNVNGKVNSIAFKDSSCSTAYLGGNFSSVHGTKVTDLVAVSPSTGAVVSGFGHTTNGQVETLLVNGGHLLVGGYFTYINGTVRDYMASVSPTTGKDDGFLHLHISGNYHFCSATRCTASNPTRVYNQQRSHGGTLDLVEGDFTSVGGASRQQIFMLNLSTGTITSWTSAEFSQACWFTEPFYVREASWSPDDTTVYIATTGFHPYDKPAGSYPRTGLCDAAAAFSSAHQAVSHRWINYTGCDSLYSTAADAGAAYFGGHERWSENPDGCDFAGPGAIADTGMEGLAVTTGKDLRNPDGTPVYKRGRGLGADDMRLTSAGLWIASDNFNNANYCGGVSGHAGICFLPYG